MENTLKGKRHSQNNQQPPHKNTQPHISGKYLVFVRRQKHIEVFVTQWPVPLIHFLLDFDLLQLFRRQVPQVRSAQNPRALFPQTRPVPFITNTQRSGLLVMESLQHAGCLESSRSLKGLFGRPTCCCLWEFPQMPKCFE